MQYGEHMDRTEAICGTANISEYFAQMWEYVDHGVSHWTLYKIHYFCSVLKTCIFQN